MVGSNQEVGRDDLEQMEMTVKEMSDEARWT